jgi:hypothetical protein
MIRYNLDLEVNPPVKKINFRHKILMMGSCFTDNISIRLSRLYFDVPAQTLGIVFNPLSLAHPFMLMKDQKAYSDADLIMNGDAWFSKHHHGAFNDSNTIGLLKKINAAHDEFISGISSAEFLFITFGSAWIYRLKDGGELVANCHKIPQEKFSKEMLGPDEIVERWNDVLAHVLSVNPGISIVFTVSPVKHLRDGIIENNVSKATLLLAVHRLCRHHAAAVYFPAYELVNDDLRDYRFYEADGAHPNEQAINYVFEKFRDAFMDKESLQYMDDMEKFIRMQSHRILRQDGQEYELYLANLGKMKKEIKLKYGVDLDS